MRMPVLAMGVFVFGGLLAGALAGIIISAVLGGLAAFLSVRLHKRRKHVIPIFCVTTVIVLAACIFGIRSFVFEWGAPGSNYDVIMSNLFWKGLWYGASLGAAAAVAAIITWAAPIAPCIPETVPANKTAAPAMPPALPSSSPKEIA